MNFFFFFYRSRFYFKCLTLRLFCLELNCFLPYFFFILVRCFIHRCFLLRILCFCLLSSNYIVLLSRDSIIVLNGYLLSCALDICILPFFSVFQSNFFFLQIFSRVLACNIACLSFIVPYPSTSFLLSFFTFPTLLDFIFIRSMSSLVSSIRSYF